MIEEENGVKVKQIRWLGRPKWQTETSNSPQS
jgi:hypothetical protein